MSPRADKARRILGVQRQLHGIEEWRLAELDRRLVEIEEAQRSLISALNDDAALQGLFLDAMSRRLRALADEAVRVGREREAQAAAVAEHATRVACAERLCADLEREDARAEEAVRLLDIVERHVGRHVGRGTPASGKIAG